MPTALISLSVSVYLYFLSGGIAVAAFLPTWIRTMAHFVPTFYAVHAMENAVFYGSTTDLGRDLAVLAGTAILAVLVGTAAFRRSIHH